MATAALVRAVGERLAPGAVSPDGVETALRELLAQRRVRWHPERTRRLATSISDELSGLGPIGPLLREPEVSEVMVNASGEVHVEREGRLEPTDVRFPDEAAVLHLIERVVGPLGLRIDAGSPWVDARLGDGSRFHAVLPPVARGGPVVSIRRFAVGRFTLTDLVDRGAVDEPTAERLADAVTRRSNILVSGGGGSGKTTLLGVLGRLVEADQRIVTIEDAAELDLADRHVVSLECRPPNVEGRGEVTMRDLVRCAMRMRADRIVVGEVRGPEALDMLQALTSGHPGSMATVHADSPEESLLRLETMVLMAAPGLAAAAIGRQLAAAFDVVVHMTRDPERRVVEIADVALGEQGLVLRA